MSKVEYWYLKLYPENPDEAPDQLFDSMDTYDDELRIGATGRVCSHNGAGELESRELAEQLREAIIERMKAKYGKKSEIKIAEWSYIGTPTYGEKHKQKIKTDSEKARKRIENPPKRKITAKRKEGWIIRIDNLKLKNANQINTMYIVSLGKKHITFAGHKDGAKKYTSKTIAEKKADEIKTRDKIITKETQINIIEVKPLSVIK